MKSPVRVLSHPYGKMVRQSPSLAAWLVASITGVNLVSDYRDCIRGGIPARREALEGVEVFDRTFRVAERIVRTPDMRASAQESPASSELGVYGGAVMVQVGRSGPGPAQTAWVAPLWECCEVSGSK